eukprot:COSAG02_NODE_1051_length_14956_cov_3.414216_14_plen_72_part_00
MQNYATYPSMPGALRALCPVRRGVITGIRPYARYQRRWSQVLVSTVVSAVVSGLTRLILILILIGWAQVGP